MTYEGFGRGWGTFCTLPAAVDLPRHANVFQTVPKTYGAGHGV